MCGTRFRASASDVWYGSQGQFGVQASALDMWYGSQGQAKVRTSASEVVQMSGSVILTCDVGVEPIWESGQVPLMHGKWVRASALYVWYGSQGQCL